MSGALLDTHALVWLVFGEADLGNEARQIANLAAHEDRLLVSAISFWEIALLTRRGRLNLFQPMSTWRRNVLQRGIREVPISGDIGILAVELDDLHRDPADRFIVAAAITHEAVLVTADNQILGWDGPLARHDART